MKVSKPSLLGSADSQTGEWSPQDSMNPMRLISSDATLSAAEVANYKDLIIHPSSQIAEHSFPVCVFITDKKWQEFVFLTLKLATEKEYTAVKHLSWSIFKVWQSLGDSKAHKNVSLKSISRGNNTH